MGHTFYIEVGPRPTPSRGAGGAPTVGDELIADGWAARRELTSGPLHPAACKAGGATGQGGRRSGEGEIGGDLYNRVVLQHWDLGLGSYWGVPVCTVLWLLLKFLF